MKIALKPDYLTKRVQFFVFLLGIILMAALPEKAFTQGPGNNFTPGFSGYVQPMIAAGYSKSISNVSDDTKKIDSLDQDANSETDFFPILLWKTVYNLDNGATQFYAGTPKENIVAGTFLLETGIRQKLSGGTILTAAWVPKLPILDNEAWKDPFLLGSDRQETDQDSQAFKVEAESIFGSPVNLRYGFGRQEIDDDQSGIYLSEQPGSTLTTADLQMLKRDSDFHLLEAQYAISFGRGIMIRPGISYLRGDATGDANSFNQFQGKVSFAYPWEQWRFFGNISLGLAEYDEANPIFEKTREDVIYGTTLGVGYTTPFGWKDFTASVFTSFKKNDTNIKFYDSTSMIIAIGLAWLF
ncbi:MAG: DUF2860 domain-containing protein [Proteobacteria bacterium]|nr:DUF2860 domain-containing protein [Desulfobacula sp.]MBU3951230.1 DUF2860 domain-containing protein [Pseudomonadota bacterium]MBU4130257.1 DUF2860 domain-containing protein [Pseudomonadota bacterium]